VSLEGICPKCGKSRSLRCPDPETKKPICFACYLKATGLFGICPKCGKGERPLPYRDRETNQHICHSCHARMIRREKGVLPRESRYPDKKAAIKALAARKKRGKQNNPKALKEEDDQLYRRARELDVPLPVLSRRGLYSTKESVVKALETRSVAGKKNNAKVLISDDTTLYRKALKFGVKLPRAVPVAVKRVTKPARLHKTPVIAPSPATMKTTKPRRKIRAEKKKPGRKAKYLSKESVIATLENREAQGKENFPSVLCQDDSALYRSVLKFGVELPTKENPPVRYYPWDLVKNQNPKDPSVFGKIGEVLTADDRVVRTSFGERGRIRRIYKKWENLNNITLHARKPLLPMVTAEREVVPV
jgi:hypothetical protein